jgi:iron(III) transport system substrate-binding protein
VPKKFVALLVAAVGLAVLPGCSGGGDKLVVYSGRNQNLIGELLDQFAAENEIDISVKYAETSELLPTLLEEGDRTRVDVFFSQDAGALAELSRERMLRKLPSRLTGDVDQRFRSSTGDWVGVTARARVIAYNTDELKPEDLPESVFDVIDPKWRGKGGFAPTNASFIAFVSALRAQAGDDRTRAFLEGLASNRAERFDNNVLTLDAVASGDVLLGLVNHYYLYNEYREHPNAPVKNHFPGQKPGGEGTFINIAGVGVLEGTDQLDAAQELVEFLLGREAQEYFRNETAEYPLAADVTAIPELPPLDSLKTIDVPLERLGAELDSTVQMIKDAGLS